MPINPINTDTKPLSDLLTQNSKGSRVDDAKLKKACTELESLFIHQMFKAMRQTLPKTRLFGGGAGEEAFQSLFDQELSRSMAQRSGIGLGQRIYQQMIRRGNPPSVDSKSSFSGIEEKGPSLSGQEE